MKKKVRLRLLNFQKKDNGLKKEDLTRKVPVNEDNNEEETVPKVPNLEMLIEDDSERDKNEVIENEVIDKCQLMKKCQQMQDMKCPES